VSVHLEHATHAVGPLDQVVVAARRQVVRAPVAAAARRPHGEEMAELGGLDCGRRHAVHQLRAPAEDDAATLALQCLVVIVTEFRGGRLLVQVAVKPERQRR